MHGDFSRSTFDRTKHLSAVLHQQGRVTLDADLNEQARVLLYQLRTAVADLIGPAGVPAGEQGGFDVDTLAAPNREPDLTISAGRMYVDGMLVENEQDTTYWDQPDGHLDPDEERDRLPAEPYLVYLRVWERLVTALEDPAIREIALGDLGPDTAARSRVVWQVATSTTTLLSSPPGPPTAEAAMSWLLDTVQREDDELPLLQARARRPDSADDDLCDLSPEARYRGPENQLYRVEVHTGGAAQEPPSGPPSRRSARPTRSTTGPNGATFTFSRENGAAVFGITSLAGDQVQLSSTGRDGKLGLEAGDWVEVVDDASASRVADDVLHGAARPLRRVLAVDAAERMVTLADAPGGAGNWQYEPGTRPDLHPLLRRWDHASAARTEDGQPLTADVDGALPLVEGTWIDLEDGVQVRFDGAPAGTARRYRPGDHWCIPARVVPGDVLWPEDEQGPTLRPPDGVEYHYAPLAWVDGVATDLRVPFSPAAGTTPTRRGTRRPTRRPTPPGR